MPRYQLLLEYDGTPFVGWQRQENGLAVQEVLEIAVHRFCGEYVNAFAAGRTDAGVHALAMSVHIELSKPHAATTVANAINQHLKPHPVAVVDAREVSKDFHARFSCHRRSYEYRIINRRAPLTLSKGRAWRISRPLDAEVMHSAAQVLVGKHDFTTFRASACQAASPVKTLERIEVMRAGEDVFVRCAAPSFLHNQVRSFVGTLSEVGRGSWQLSDVKAALAARDRAACGPVAPAHGLYFLKADYPAS